jgi:hypothetical protein
MAREDRDGSQKLDALRYLVVTGSVPWLEVPVTSAVELGSQEKLLTDVDVLGLYLRPDGSISRTLVDCKTRKMPPIERVFWLAGLKAYLRADEGIAILSRRAEKAHRLSAKVVGVRLFDHSSFLDYASAAAPIFARICSYACEGEAWFRIRERPPRIASIQQLLRRATAEIPLSSEVAKPFRRLIASLREARGELDPAKDVHMAVFTETVLAASVLFVRLLGELRTLYDLDDTRDELISVLRFYVWGGPEGVTMFQRMAESDGRSVEEAEAVVLAWPQFIELVRGMLDEPTAVHNCCMPLRELALRYVADKMPEADARLGKLLMRPRARQFIRRIANYLAYVGRLPPDFARRLDTDIDALAEPIEQAMKATALVSSPGTAS